MGTASFHLTTKASLINFKRILPSMQSCQALGLANVLHVHWAWRSYDTQHSILLKMSWNTVLFPRFLAKSTFPKTFGSNFVVQISFDTVCTLKKALWTCISFEDLHFLDELSHTNVCNGFLRRDKRQSTTFSFIFLQSLLQSFLLSGLVLLFTVAPKNVGLSGWSLIHSTVLSLRCHLLECSHDGCIVKVRSTQTLFGSQGKTWDPSKTWKSVWRCD